MLDNYRPLIIKNKNEFFDKICILFDDKNKYSRASKYCRQLAIQYTDSKVAEQFRDLF
jgi:hypothetical protein